MRGLSNRLTVTAISLPRVCRTQLRVNRMLLVRQVGLNLNEINADKGCKLARAYRGPHCKGVPGTRGGGGDPLIKIFFFWVNIAHEK